MTLNEIPLDVWLKIGSGVVGLLLFFWAVIRYLDASEERVKSEIRTHAALTNDRLTKIETTVFPYSEEINKIKERMLNLVEKNGKNEAQIENHSSRIDQHQRQIEQIQQRK